MKSEESFSFLRSIIFVKEVLVADAVSPASSPLVKNEIKDSTTPDTTISAAVEYWIHSLLFVVIEI
jgi:hypothetical protein